MIWGEQWDCPCGWSNLFIRKRCRNCGEQQPNGAVTETIPQVMDAVMKHARDDYDNIQEITTNGTTRHIPADEPVFLIRGQDVSGAAAVRFWAMLAEAAGAASDILKAATDHADKMDAWPKKKVADLPARQEPRP